MIRKNYLRRSTIFFVLIFAIFFSTNLYSQKSKSNIEVLFGLIKKISQKESNNGKKLFFISKKSEYKPLVNFANNLKPNINVDDSVTFVLDSAKVNYIKVFRKGIFGEYFIVRSAGIKISDKNKKTSFYEIIDTVNAFDYNEIENSGFEFAKSKLPSEPFWESIIEPVIFIATTTAIVFLLFFGRS